MEYSDDFKREWKAGMKRARAARRAALIAKLLFWKNGKEG